MSPKEPEPANAERKKQKVGSELDKRELIATIIYASIVASGNTQLEKSVDSAIVAADLLLDELDAREQN